MLHFDWLGTAMKLGFEYIHGNLYPMASLTTLTSYPMVCVNAWWEANKCESTVVHPARQLPSLISFQYHFFYLVELSLDTQFKVQLQPLVAC